MATRVAVYRIAGHTRSRIMCEAMHRGIIACGDYAELLDESTYRRPEYDAAVFYGLEGNTPRLFREYREAGKPAVYIDLGWWKRREGGRFSGYHKISVGSRHPRAYYRRFAHRSDRFREMGVNIEPWRRSDHGHRHIVLAGMGDKAAAAEGYKPEQWEREAIKTIRKHSNRPIIYRPKPSWKTARPIPGVLYSPRTQELEPLLQGAWAVVTHHSNVAVEAVLAGVPAFAVDGVGADMGLAELERIESPIYPDGRELWAADIAYCQWSVAEMAAGLPWAHLKREELIS